MSYDLPDVIRVEKDGPIRVVRLNRPEQLNAINDELHLALRPVLLGRGENLFAGLDLPALGYECVESKSGERATHMILRKRA